MLTKKKTPIFFNYNKGGGPIVREQPVKIIYSNVVDFIFVAVSGFPPGGLTTNMRSCQTNDITFNFRRDKTNIIQFVNENILNTS